MSKRMWESSSRPAWQQKQAARLEQAHFKQRRQDEEWKKNQERLRIWREVWEETSGEAEKTNREGRSESSSSRWERGESGGRYVRESTASSMPRPSSSSWEEDKDPTMITTDRVTEDMASHRMKSITPLSFQPQRHVTMILGRPVVVPLWFKAHSTM